MIRLDVSEIGLIRQNERTSRFHGFFDIADGYRQLGDAVEDGSIREGQHRRARQCFTNMMTYTLAKPKQCPECHGTGKQRFDSTRRSTRCSRCHGQGVSP